MTTAKQIIGLITLHVYLGAMFFLSKELQSQSIDWTDDRKNTPFIDDDQIKIKINEHSEKTGIPLEMTMPIHRARSSAIAEDSINNIRWPIRDTLSL